ncbi:MAG: YkvA family protein [Candidatus Kapaibacterium sp.]
MQVEQLNKYQEEYSEVNFFQKIALSAKKAGSKLIEIALTLYYSLMDKDTPKWAKGVIIGALGYFILPMDAIPDFLPGAGFADDFGTLAGALTLVALHVKEEHKALAQRRVGRWFKDMTTKLDSKPE